MIPASYGNWTVVQVNDDGRRRLVSQGMCALAAEKVAGAMRDASTDDLIEDGWNFVAMNGAKAKEEQPDSGMCFTSLKMFDPRFRRFADGQLEPSTSPPGYSGEYKICTRGNGERVHSPCDRRPTAGTLDNPRQSSVVIDQPQRRSEKPAKRNSKITSRERLSASPDRE